MARAGGVEQYVLLPTRGLRAERSSTAPGAREFLMGVEGAGGEGVRPLRGGRGSMRVLGSIGPGGAKLVELAPEAALSIRARYPGLRLVPVVHYTPAHARRALVEEDQPPPPEAPEAQAVMVQVVSQKDRAPVAGAFVVGYVDLAAGLGVQGVTDADGWVDLTLDAATVKFERV